jgi:hypothetical protein
MFVLRVWLVLLSVVSVASAAELQLLNNSKIQGQIVAIDPKGVTFKPTSGAEKFYSNNEIVTVDMGIAPKDPGSGKFIAVELTDGTIFNCSDFKIKGTTAYLTLLAPEKKERTIQLPTTSIYTMLREAQETLNVLEFKKRLNELRGQRRDIYMFARGEGANRKLTALTGTFGEGSVDPEMNDKLKFTTDNGKEQMLFQKAVHGLMFSQVANENPPQAVCRVVDVQRNTLLAQSIAIRDSKVFVKTVSGVDVEFPSIELISRFEYSTGALKFLSELKPTNVVRTDNSESPFASVVFDKNLDDKTLSISGNKYEKGLSIHAGTALTWTINGDFRRLKGILGVDDEFEIASSVKIIIEADGREVFKQTVKKKDKPVEVNLDVTNVKLLRVVVEADDPSGSDLGHQVNFVDAKVTK